MKSMTHFRQKGFTLVEMLVVIAIMAILLVLGANVLRTAGKGRSVETAVTQIDNLIREARDTAQGNDTLTRVVFAADKKDLRGRKARNSSYLRYAALMIFKKNDRKDGSYDGVSSDWKGVWELTSEGITLPDGVYFSPHYSKPLEWIDGAGSSNILGEATMRISRGKGKKVYYIEFDEKGRVVVPNETDLKPAVAQRLVFFRGQLGRGRNSRDGIIPSATDKSGRPKGAKGLVVWPTGYTSLLRTIDHIKK